MKPQTLRNQLILLPASHIAKRIRSICDRKGLSQAALATASGNSRQVISYVMGGKRGITIATLYSIAIVLGVEPGVLLPSCADVLKGSELFCEQSNIFILKEKSDATK